MEVRAATCYCAPMPRGPGPVAAVHRIFIVTALIGALAYTVWSTAEFRRTGAPTAVLGAALGVLVAAGMVLYLRKLRGLGRRLTPPD
jgi:hypothetical protein